MSAPERGERGQHGCPDGGACHHECERACWRVFNAEPLTIAGWGERWPAVVRETEMAKLTHRERDELPAPAEPDLLSRARDARDCLRGGAGGGAHTRTRAIAAALRWLNEGIEEEERRRAGASG